MFSFWSYVFFVFKELDVWTAIEIKISGLHGTFEVYNDILLRGCFLIL